MEPWVDRTALRCYRTRNHPWGWDRLSPGPGDRTGEGMCGGRVAGAAFVALDQRGSCSPRGRSPIARLAPLCEQFVLGKTANKTQEPIPGSAARGV